MKKLNIKKWNQKIISIVLGCCIGLTLTMAGETYERDTYAEDIGGGNAEASTEAPASTENPDKTEAPASTETPASTEIPATTETPVIDTPVMIEPQEEEEPTHAPKVVVSTVSTDVEQIEPGSDVTITIGLKNTSTEVSLYNMKITYESVSGELIPKDSSNSKYLSSLGAGSSTSLTFTMHIPKDIKSYSQKISISMDYEDEDAMSYSSSEVVFVNIYQPIGFHADNPIVPASVESGTTGSISLNLFNTGKATIYNACCKLECRGFLDSGTYYVGTIAPESSATAYLNPIASNRQYGALGDPKTDKYGPVTGKIIITYEDEAGNEYSEEVKVSTDITAPADEVEKVEIKEIKYSSQWWKSIVALLVLIDGLVVFIAFYFRKHRV